MCANAKQPSATIARVRWTRASCRTSAARTAVVSGAGSTWCSTTAPQKRLTVNARRIDASQLTQLGRPAASSQPVEQDREKGAAHGIVTMNIRDD